MTQGIDGVRRKWQKLVDSNDTSELRARLAPDHSTLPNRIPGASLTTADAIERRWKVLDPPATPKAQLAPASAVAAGETYANNIENYIGELRVPVGVAGPLRVNGLHTKADYYIPLATTEAALVASYHRGCRLVSAAGGCTSMCLSEGIVRSPGYICATLADAAHFASWISDHVPSIRAAAEATTRHGRLQDLRLNIEGNHVYLLLEFQTQDAAGQNMATIATEAACEFIKSSCPIALSATYVEANMSGDKKATAQSFQSVRGKKVSADIHLPDALVRKLLHCSAREMEEYWRISAMGSVMSGAIGIQGHYANGLAALYLATGQDVACVSESAVGMTRFETTADGLYAAVTLPNLVVGTVGGGTGLPTQNAGLEILGLAGNGNAQALAEVCAALALAGELSIIGALTANEFTRAHQKRAREK